MGVGGHFLPICPPIPDPVASRLERGSFSLIFFEVDLSLLPVWLCLFSSEVYLCSNVGSLQGCGIDQWCGQITIQRSDKITIIQKLLHLKKSAQPKQQRAN